MQMKSYKHQIIFIFKILLFIFGSLYLIIVGLLYINQESLFFHANKLDKNHQFTFVEKHQEINIKTSDNINLHGLLFNAEKSKGLVFYLHGNAGTVDTWGKIASNYTNLGYDIFILDYRGFGKSEGEISSEEQLFSDISSAYNQLKKKYKEENIIITGYSIGSGMATYLASINKPKALILQAPYYCLQDLATEKFPIVPNFAVKYKIPTFEFIKKVKAPIYIFHGDEDYVIPYENSLKLKTNIKSNDKLFTLENQGHLGINENGIFLSELKDILK